MAILEVHNLKKIYTTRFGGNQVQALADLNFSVEKGERDGRTYTQVERLSQQRRKEELARLTGGAVISDAILKSAGELLTEAEGYKQNRKKQQESS